MLIALSIIALAFILRSTIMFKHKWVGGDTFWHLLMAKMLRKGENINKKSDMFLDSSPYYPPVYAKLISFLPKRFDSSLRFISPILDLITMLVLFWFSYSFLTGYLIYIPLLVYAIMPILILTSFNTSPRMMSNTLLTISILIVFFYFITGNWLYLLLSSVLASVMHLTNRFATQVIVLLLVAQSIVFNEPILILFLALSFLISIIISKGYYIRVFKAYIKKLKLHFRYGDLVRGRRIEKI